MHRTILTLLAAAVAYIASAETEMTLSNCQSDIVAYVSVSRSIDSAGAALYYPETTMKSYTGCTITSISIGTVTSTSTDAIRLFITEDLEGTPDYEQTCTATKSGWNTFELDTPYTITGKALYIGYEISGVVFLCVCEQLVSAEEWVLKNSDGWAVYDGIYSFAISATVTGDLPEYNVSFESLIMPSYTLTSENITCSGTFINLAVDTVKNITLTYYTDGDEAYSETIDVEKTAFRETGSFITDGFCLYEECNPVVCLAITAVNGHDDEDPSDNTSRSKNILCRNYFTARNVLAEVFSTELCVNCAAAHKRIEAAYGDIDNLFEVGHHSGYYTDSYTVDASTEYEWFYGTMVYAPAVMLDRTRFDNCEDGYSYEDTPIMTPSDDWLLTLYEEANATPAYVTVDLTADYDKNTRQLSIDVGGQQLLPVDDIETLRLNVFVLEDSIFTTTQKDTSGEFYHRYSVREVVTGTWGDTIAWTTVDGDTLPVFASQLSTTVADTIDISQVYVVAFVADYDSTDATDCRVMNSARVRIVVDDDDVTGITSVKTGGTAARVCGDVIIAGGDTRRVGVYDMQGRCLMSVTVDGDVAGNRYIPITRLPQGTYIMRAEGDSGGQSVKFAR